MSNGARFYKYDGRNIEGVRTLNCKSGSITYGTWGACDGRSRSRYWISITVGTEQVCGLINLHVRLVGPTLGIASCDPHSCIRKQQRDRVV